MTGDSRSNAPKLGAPGQGAHRAVVTVDAAVAGKRLDQALAALVPALSRRGAQRVIGMGAVYLGGQRCRQASRAVRAGDVLTATWHPEVRAAERFDLDVVHEDTAVAVVAKPSGQLSQGSELGDVGSLVYAINQRFGASARLMHRLDKPASGLLLVARHAAASAALTPQLREHTLERRYLAITQGSPASGTCSLPLFKDGRKMRIAAADEAGALPATSHVEVVAEDAGRALVAVRLETGRTHQIRLHLSALGAPLVGDRRYGGPAADRLCLHAQVLGFNHPDDGATRRFTRSPPADFWAVGGPTLEKHAPMA